MPVTETLSLDRLRRDGQAFSEEISRGDSGLADKLVFSKNLKP